MRASLSILGSFPIIFWILCGLFVDLFFLSHWFRPGDDEGFGGMQQKVSARELDDILANERTSPMVVDFYATWCGPCILLAQELEQVGHLWRHFLVCFCNFLPTWPSVGLTLCLTSMWNVNTTD